MSASHRAKIAAGMRRYHAKCRQHSTGAPRPKHKAEPPPTTRPQRRVTLTSTARPQRRATLTSAARPQRRATLTSTARPRRSKLGPMAGKQQPTKGVRTYLSALARIQSWAPTASKNILFTT